MQLFPKIALLSCAVAVASSAATVLALRSTDSEASIPEATNAAFDASKARINSFVPVSSVPGANTDFTQVAESTINGVVSVKNYQYANQRSQNQGYFIDPFEFFFGQQQQTPRQQQRKQSESDLMPVGMGSGVIISKDGYIVTNYHVVSGADKIEVTLNDNTTFNATLVGEDETSDLALLKVDASDLHVIPMGDSDQLRVGEWELAEGNHFGFNSTVRAGIVSAQGRAISEAGRTSNAPKLDSYIQTDAAVNPGNSGGALVNLRGELVGINSSIYSQTGNYSGTAFAIPTSIVTKVVTDLKQYGAVQRAMLGIAFSDLTPDLKKEKDITAVNDGILVREVSPGGAADRAGIEPDDVIIAINGVATHKGAQMMEQMSLYSPGDKVKVTVVRGNKEKTIEVTLLNNQGNTNIKQATNANDLGVTFKAPEASMLRQLGLRSGLQVAQVRDGRFKEAGIKEGYIIADINNMRVTSTEDVEKIYKAIMDDDQYDKVMFITGFYPTGRKTFYAVPLVTEE